MANLAIVAKLLEDDSSERFAVFDTDLFITSGVKKDVFG